ncbi:hypothetical protein TanjilG_11560 [Lupinus angustifolius]|uniref:Pentacotripeptide-repeat region of PRORP domain-containing protein n=1 Tax=Lupinus angustifolius TaxID=3871 RepID=A0A1J7G9L9_LUPAN|nr:hypothetical protein TanjilG_11560 [Lupinus angustifolius]
MVELGFEVDVRMMGTLVRRLCKKGLVHDAEKVFEKMLEKDQRTFEVMVQVLCERKKIDEALGKLNDMVRLGYCPSVIMFDKVIQCLCAEGRVEEGVSTLLLLHENGRVANRITYDVLIKEFNAQGRLVFASILFSFALKQGVVTNREFLTCKVPFV